VCVVGLGHQFLDADITKKWLFVNIDQVIFAVIWFSGTPASG
jgi:hypothetical protein